MISHKHKFVFIDIVKTAGTSINKALEIYGTKGKHHAINRPLPPLQNINGALAPYLSDKILQEYFKFTIVRNPYDRLISLYAFTQESALQKLFAKEGWNGLLNSNIATTLPQKNLDRNSYWPTDFAIYVEQLIDYRNYYCDYTLEKYIPMVDWLKNKDNNIIVDYVGYYETLQESINKIMLHLQLPSITIPHLNASKNVYKEKAIATLLKNKSLQNIIYEYYKEDFIEFNYKKELPWQ